MLTPPQLVLLVGSVGAEGWTGFYREIFSAHTVVVLLKLRDWNKDYFFFRRVGFSGQNGFTAIPETSTKCVACIKLETSTYAGHFTVLAQSSWKSKSYPRKWTEEGKSIFFTSTWQWKRPQTPEKFTRNTWIPRASSQSFFSIFVELERLADVLSNFTFKIGIQP